MQNMLLCDKIQLSRLWTIPYHNGTIIERSMTEVQPVLWSIKPAVNMFIRMVYTKSYSVPNIVKLLPTSCFRSTKAHFPTVRRFHQPPKILTSPSCAPKVVSTLRVTPHRHGNVHSQGVLHKWHTCLDPPSTGLVMAILRQFISSSTFLPQWDYSRA